MQQQNNRDRVLSFIVCTFFKEICRTDDNAGALYPIQFHSHIPVPTIRLSKENILSHREAHTLTAAEHSVFTYYLLEGFTLNLLILS
jgi:hypothetical protein